MALPELQRPRKLRDGDQVRVIAPSRSRGIIGRAGHDATNDRLRSLGLEITFGARVDEHDAFDSSAVSSRIADLHDAFADPDVAGILTVIGGFNSNQLLEHLDWDLIGANPKVFCGYSDITALNHALLAHTGMLTYSGPHWSSFGMRDHFADTFDWFRRTVFAPGAGGHDGPLALWPAAEWTDDAWFLDQDDRHPQRNDGWWSLGGDGVVTGRIIGANLATLSLLPGTPHMPDLEACVLVLEDDFESQPHHFDRLLHALLQHLAHVGTQVRGVVIGRFQRDSHMTRELLTRITDIPALRGLPIVANADYGHTSPMFTLPIGGEIEVRVDGDDIGLRLLTY
ncbi:MAG TPA: S66 peptidase family protein [Euzebyales bacterium]